MIRQYLQCYIIISPYTNFALYTVHNRITQSCVIDARSDSMETDQKNRKDSETEALKRKALSDFKCSNLNWYYGYANLNQYHVTFIDPTI